MVRSGTFWQTWLDGFGMADMAGNDVFRSALAKFGRVWQSGFVGKGKFRSVLVRYVKAVEVRSVEARPF